MVAAQGDIALGDAPPGKKGWRIGVGTLNPAKEEPSRFLLLANCGVSTSGDAMQFVVLGGKRYSHIVDPRTGVGLTHRNSTTVIAPNAMTADGLATTLTVLGIERGMEFVKKQKNVEALMIAATDEADPPKETKSAETKGFAAPEVKGR
jgi:FAD:protein FMN transferase